MAAGALEIVAGDQKIWSTTANTLKSSLDAWRLAVLVLAVAAAVLETLAAQIHTSYGGVAQALGYTGAAAMAVSAVIQNRRLGRERTQAWIHSRATAEALKRELFLCRASANPYNGADPLVLLIERRNAILAKADPYRRYTALVAAPTIDAISTLDADGYIRERAQKQIDWFRARAASSARVQNRFELAGFWLSILAALLGAATTIAKAQEFSAWVAVLTTIGGTLASYVAAQRYEQIATSYLATADRLNGVIGNPKTGTAAALAEACEAALAEENQSWIAAADETIAKQAPDAGDRR